MIVTRKGCEFVLFGPDFREALLWVAESNIPHKYTVMAESFNVCGEPRTGPEYGAKITFFDEGTAALFKLTWGGD